EALDKENKQQQELLRRFQTYQDERKRIQEEYLEYAAQLRKKGADEEAAIAIKKGEERLTQLELEHSKELESYKILFDGIEQVSNKYAESALNSAKKTFEQARKEGKLTEKAYKELVEL